MRFILSSLFCTAIVAAAPGNGSTNPDATEFCAIKTVAVTGGDEAARQTSKKVEKKTWMKKVSAPGQADGILDAQIMLTNFSVSLSGDRVTSASREGYVQMTLKRRDPEKVLWERKSKPLGTSNLIDDLLAELQKEAGCQKR